MRFAFFILIISLLSAFDAYSQELRISLRDDSRNPLPGATLQLTNLSDSTFLHTVSDLSGKASFKGLRYGLYSLQISYVGFETIQRSISVNRPLHELSYQMRESSVSLEAVTVTATRPLIRQEGDKMIIDPEPIAAISSNTLEVLESTPGLFVDQDGGIFLSSATPAVVYINGREQKLSNQDITNLLRSIPPESVERIEVLRTPSTKYDAASTGGIINIVLKKGVKIGRFGSVNANYSRGQHDSRSAGFSINNSGSKSTAYLNFNYSFNDRLEELNSVRMIATDTSITQAALNRGLSNQLYTGFGLTYDLSEKFSLSYDGRLNLNRRDALSENNNLFETTPQILIAESDNRINYLNDFLSFQQDFGSIYKIDTLGSEWDNKLSYSFTSNNASQHHTTDIIFPINNTATGYGDNDQSRHFLQFQSDLTLKSVMNITFETGVKTALQYYSSSSAFFRDNNGIDVIDIYRTQEYSYQEAINAGYFQASRPLPYKFELKGGIRAEHTYMNGRQSLPADTGFVINRTDFFPYIFLSRPIIEMFGVKLQTFLIYRKTINRPGYHNLNPYIRYVDQFMYESGNPALKPQFTDNLELNISFNDIPLFAVGRNYTKDIFSSVIYRDENFSEVSVMTWDNLGSSRETYFRLLAGIPPGGRYFFAIGSQYNLNEYEGFYEGEPFSYSRGSWRLFTFHSLRLFKETRLTMSGFMMLNGNYGFFELQDFGAINLGIRQNFYRNKLTVTLNARDVFRTMITKFELNQGSIPTYGDRYTDNQRVGLNIRYNFGIRTKNNGIKNLIPEEMEMPE